MTFTPAEAEQILRERWEGSEAVGGFASEQIRQHKLQEMRDEFGDAVDQYDLIGNVTWSDYEEGADYTLWVHRDDQSLLMFEAGATVYGEFGTDFAGEVVLCTITDWLNQVESCADHAEHFTGC